ncbi:hypothetical protein [Yoonia sp. 2307UL14-13]|uniref:hypothetical protein n=1 Tax=Yoonia sp. 2307UL14-13 TaxID=3126506 RepID=UPI00309FB2F3
MQDEPKGRILKFEELDMLGRFFGSSDVFKLVMVYDTATPEAIEQAKRKNTRLRSHELNGDIYMLDGDFRDNYAEADINTKAIFIHEMAHIWQGKNAEKHSTSSQLIAKAESYERIIAKQEKAYQLALKDMAPEKRAIIEKLALMHLNRMMEEENAAWDAANNYKIQYEKFVNDIDPIAVVHGPKPKWQVRAEAEMTRSLVYSSVDHETPKPGETFSEFLWRNPEIRANFSSRQSMVQHWIDSETLDYNYILQPIGRMGFWDLHVEAQAQIITDYFLIKSGVDPRTVPMSLSVSGAQRPPIDFYEMVVPFACHDRMTLPSLNFKD